ncbi:2-dehydro-3-deoxygalactonokinase [Martelella endophytica]|uniref:2-dehydro-3-deoxygalactonokinase n=1 Tax=Martelella endophytica TaxID=1486262 RepID=UPI000AD92BFB|nr:2-dehydro-3-deoxygalactonokinase [Martelella endophytica]
MRDAAIAPYLSGVVIGHELLSARHRFRESLAGGVPLFVIGVEGISERYRTAMRPLDLQAPTMPGNTAPAGLYRFALALQGGL